MYKTVLDKGKKIFNFSWLLIPVTLLLSFICRSIPAGVESLYSDSTNKVVRIVLSNISGIFHVSIAEILLVILVLTALFLLSAFVTKLVSNRDKVKTISYFLRDLLSLAGLVYFAFFLLWGANYYRQPFNKIANLEIKPSSISELKRLCSVLIIRANELNYMVYNTKSSVLTEQQLLNNVDDIFHNSSKKYPVLSGSYASPKGIIISSALSYAGISGFYFPFTAEANINKDIPLFMQPSTACHEASHQRGFAREDEANFISYLVCTASKNNYFNYSGTCLALIYSMDALYNYDINSYNLLRDQYSAGLRKDFSHLNNFWKKYEGPIDSLSSRINNAYLKANLQKDGINSYGRMVDLLLAQLRATDSK